MAAIAVMKFRSSLLLACMAVVPAVAMFSHTIPRSWRLTAQRLARGEGFAWHEGVAQADEPAHAANPVSVEAADPAMPAGKPAPPAPAPPQAGLVSLPTVSRVGDDVSRVRAAVETQLASLGAVAFECVQPTAGGPHRCSCRVPADPSGQLQRVFQSSNPDQAVALKNLLGQVQFWKHRQAALPGSSASR